MEQELVSKTLRINRSGPVYYISIPSFDETGLVRDLYSTRRGGVSEGNLGPMNLGFGRGDPEENVLENYRRICFTTGIYPGDIVMCSQVHGDHVVYVDQQMRGSGLMGPILVDDTDAMITDKREVCLLTFHADCCPVYLLDPVKKAIGLAHAGWKGTALEIGKKTVEAMKETFGSRPKDILGAVGPSIGPCCFEVEEDVASIFSTVFGTGDMLAQEGIRPNAPIVTSGKAEGKYYVNLWEANRVSLLRAGLRDENITITDLCTMHNPEYFHSHRRSGTDRGTQAAFLELI